jgi:hypothetical protein
MWLLVVGGLLVLGALWPLVKDWYSCHVVLRHLRGPAAWAPPFVGHMLPCMKDSCVGFTEQLDTLRKSAAVDGRRPQVWKAHFLGQYSAMFSGPEGRAFLHQHQVGSSCFCADALRP